MSIYESILLITGTAAMLLSLLAGHKRGALWIAAIMIDLVVSTAYWRADLPYGDVFTAVCDFSVCVLIFLFGRWRWELRLYLLMQFSVLISICDFAASLWSPGWIDHDTYSSMLEAVNYLAFIGVGGIGAFALAAGSLPAGKPWTRFRPSYLPLLAQGRKVAG